MGAQHHRDVNTAEAVETAGVSWIAHTESARLAVAKGDYDDDVKEMKLALAVAPDDSLKSQLTTLVARLQNKEDINR